MGNQASLDDSKDFKKLAAKYTFEKKFNDSRFGEIKLLKASDSTSKIFQKDISMQSQFEFDAYIKDIKARAELDNSNLLKILGLASKKEDVLCANFFKISLYFEAFDYDLEQEIVKRATNKEYYEESELWYLLDCLVASLSYLEENNISHGDLRPYNIFVNENREYKLCDPRLFVQYYGSLGGVFEGLEGKSHLPGPQLFESLKDLDNPTLFDKARNDVFSLALTILEAGLLEKPFKIYNWDNFSVDFSILEEYLTALKSRYSDALLQILKVMLKYEENERPTFVLLDRELAPYRSDIKFKFRILIDQKKADANQQLISYRAENTKPVEVDQAIDFAESNEDEIDKRVKEALKRSEDTISKSTPKKYQNTIDPIVKSYMDNQIIEDGTIFKALSPHISLESKYSPTLNQYPEEQNDFRSARASEVNQTYVTNNLVSNNLSATSQVQNNTTANFYQYKETANINQSATSITNFNATPYTKEDKKDSAIPDYTKYIYPSNTPTQINYGLYTPSQVPNLDTPVNSANVNIETPVSKPDYGINPNTAVLQRSGTLTPRTNIPVTATINKAPSYDYVSNPFVNIQGTNTSQTFENKNLTEILLAGQTSGYNLKSARKEESSTPSYTNSNGPATSNLTPVNSTGYNYNYGTNLGQNSNVESNNYTAYNYGTNSSQTTTGNQQYVQGGNLINIDTILEKSKAVEVSSTVKTTTLTSTNNYQITSPDGKPIDTAELMRQVQETLKRSQSYAQQ